MKTILHILLAYLCACSTSAQERAFNISSGNSLENGLSISAMGWIETNEAKKVISRLCESVPPDSTLYLGCNYVSRHYPPTDGNWPTFLNEDCETHSFERTFYKSIDDVQKCTYQIYVEQMKRGDDWCISRVEFRGADTLIPRSKELKNLLDESTPPPPPPPPGLPK